MSNAAGVRQIFSEKAFKAPALERLLDELDQGDKLLVTKLDPLACSTRDLLRIIDRIETEGAHFKSLGETWAARGGRCLAWI